MTSRPKISGILSREPSSASCCALRVASAPVTFSSEPTRPVRIWSKATFWLPGLAAGPVRSRPLLYWFSWPTFSSSVIWARSASIFFSVAGLTSPWAERAVGMRRRDTTKASTSRVTRIEGLPGRADSTPRATRLPSLTRTGQP